MNDECGEQFVGDLGHCTLPADHDGHHGYRASIDLGDGRPWQFEVRAFDSFVAANQPPPIQDPAIEFNFNP